MIKFKLHYITVHTNGYTKCIKMPLKLETLKCLLHNIYTLLIFLLMLALTELNT